MKRLGLAVLMLPALIAAGGETLLRSKVLEHTQLHALKSEWKVVTDKPDDDGDPEFELEREHLEVSINETGTFPLVTIDADDAIKDYMGMMKNMLQAEPRDWPEKIAKPDGSACVAFVAKLYAQENETLPLNITCYLPYRGGTAIVHGEIDPEANKEDHTRLSALLASIKLK